jgi:hypothetical protein
MDIENGSIKVTQRVYDFLTSCFPDGIYRILSQENHWIFSPVDELRKNIKKYINTDKIMYISIVGFTKIK